MDNKTLSNRITKRGRFGRPRIIVFSYTRWIIMIVIIIRMGIAVRIIIIQPQYIAFACTTFGLALLDGISYLRSPLDRRHNYLSHLIALIGAATVSANVVWVAVIATHEQQKGIQPLIVVALVATLFTAGIANTMRWYCGIYNPTRLPRLYEPVVSVGRNLEVANAGGIALIDHNHGPLAQLYRTQEASRDNNREAQGGGVHTAETTCHVSTR